MDEIEVERQVAAVLSTPPDTIMRPHGEEMPVVTPTETEKAALQAAGDMGSEFLDTLNKTDLDKITPDELNQLVEGVVTGFQDRLKELVEINQQSTS